MTISGTDIGLYLGKHGPVNLKNQTESGKNKRQDEPSGMSENIPTAKYNMMMLQALHWTLWW